MIGVLRDGKRPKAETPLAVFAQEAQTLGKYRWRMQ